MKTPVFPRSEYERRHRAVREQLDARGLRALLVASPENIYYLTGLDHQGYFAFHMLVFPLEGEPILVNRQMEARTVADQVPSLRHFGYTDSSSDDRIQGPGSGRPDDELVLTTRDDDGRAAGLRPWDMSFGVETHEPDSVADLSAPVEALLRALREVGADSGRLGIELGSSFLPYTIATQLREHLDRVDWHDATHLVADCRVTQSPVELERTRQAATISEAMMLAAIAAAGPGVPVHDVMAAIYDAMFRRGGTYPGFVPLVRTTRTIRHEHGTWQEGNLRKRDLLFLEMAGCVRRYHAPLGRLVFIGGAPPSSGWSQRICREALELAADTIGPGVRAGEVYRAWQGRLDRAGLSAYTRHHCGYSVGIGFPPSWSGGGVPVGLRRGSTMELREGMVFHLMSWLLRSGRGDAFLSDTVVVTGSGCEFLTRISREVLVR